MSEIRVDIMTTLGKYTVLASSDYETAALREIQRGIERENDLEGWTPFDDPETTPATPFVLGKGAEIQHLKAYVHEAAKRDSGTDIEVNIPSYPGPRRVEFKDRLLGQECNLVAYIWNVDGLLWILPVLINGLFCLDVLQEHNVELLINRYADDKEIPPDDYRVLLPEIPIGEQDAVEYMRELVTNERPHMSGDGKGKADNAVPYTRKVNNKALSADITLVASDVGALSATAQAADSAKLDGKLPEHYASQEALDNGLSAKATTVTYTATIPATGWTGSAAPYSIATITVSGMLATDTPIVDIVQTGTEATDSVMRENWGKITRIVTKAGGITVYASEIPSAAIPIQLKAVR